MIFIAATERFHNCPVHDGGSPSSLIRFDFEFRACELLGYKPEEFALKDDEDCARCVAYAMIRHSVESELAAMQIQANFGKVK